MTKYCGHPRVGEKPSSPSSGLRPLMQLLFATTRRHSLMPLHFPQGDPAGQRVGNRPVRSLGGRTPLSQHQFIPSPSLQPRRHTQRPALSRPASLSRSEPARAPSAVSESAHSNTCSGQPTTFSFLPWCFQPLKHIRPVSLTSLLDRRTTDSTPPAGVTSSWFSGDRIPSALHALSYKRLVICGVPPHPLS